MDQQREAEARGRDQRAAAHQHDVPEPGAQRVGREAGDRHRHREGREGHRAERRRGAQLLGHVDGAPVGGRALAHERAERDHAEQHQRRRPAHGHAAPRRRRRRGRGAPREQPAQEHERRHRQHRGHDREVLAAGRPRSPRRSPPRPRRSRAPRSRARAAPTGSAARAWRSTSIPCAFIATSSAPLAMPSTSSARNSVTRLSASPGSSSVPASSGKPALMTGRLPKRSTGAPASLVPTTRPMARPTSAVPSSPSDSSSDSLIAGSRGAHVPETVEWIRKAAETAARGELGTGSHHDAAFGRDDGSPSTSRAARGARLMELSCCRPVIVSLRCACWSSRTT